MEISSLVTYSESQVFASLEDNYAYKNESIYFWFDLQWHYVLAKNQYGLIWKWRYSLFWLRFLIVLYEHEKYTLDFLHIHI